MTAPMTKDAIRMPVTSPKQAAAIQADLDLLKLMPVFTCDRGKIEYKRP